MRLPPKVSELMRQRVARTSSDRELLLDSVLLVSAGLLTVWAWIRDRAVVRRLSDVQVPNNAVLLAMGAARVGQRPRENSNMKLQQSMSELGTRLGKRMVQSNERSKQLLALPKSLDSFARAADDRDQRLVGLQGSMEPARDPAPRQKARLSAVPSAVEGMPTPLTRQRLRRRAGHANTDGESVCCWANSQASNA